MAFRTSSTRTSSKRPIKKKYCFFCKETRTLGIETTPDYKNAALLRKFVTERGKIVGKTRSGLCSPHQRSLANAVKRARFLALLPYTAHI